MSDVKNPVGRPRGFRMSQQSKDSIAKSKMGQKHEEETKTAISDGVKRHHETGAPIELIIRADLSIGTFKSKRDYVDICISNPVKGGKSYKQRLSVALFEQQLGRKLKGQEQVHHWGAKDNNDMRFLSLCKNKKEHNILDKLKAQLGQELQDFINGR